LRRRLPVTTAMLDGELVALRPDGVSSFPELQALLSEGADHRLHFYAFDLLHLNGWDLRPCALVDRKGVLAGPLTVDARRNAATGRTSCHLRYRSSYKQQFVRFGFDALYNKPTRC
jgi:ATP-dependent DNA ligase